MAMRDIARLTVATIAAMHRRAAGARSSAGTLF